MLEAHTGKGTSLLFITTCLALCLAAPGAASAQEAAQDTDSSSSALPAAVAPQAQSASASDIVVTGSRVVTSGINAPTPVTVVSVEQLQLAAPRSLVDGVLQLPQFRGSVSVQNQANGTTASNGSAYLNLRGLGTSRTLVLMDGRRLAPNQNTSAVDAAMIPEALVKRVDVVTGGASAAYGSDAVAGVANFILDNKFVGLRVNAQGGLSTYGDNENYKVDVTWGASLADDRLHIVVSALDSYSGGVPKYADRHWVDRAKVAITNPNVTASNPASPTNPKQLVVLDGMSSIAANGGLITNTLLRGTTFDPGGTARAFQYGSLVSSSQMQGSDPGTFNPNLLLVLQAKQHRDQIYSHVSYDVSDNFSAFVQVLGSRNFIAFNSIPTFELSGTAFTIFRDNAFLPGSVRDVMLANNIESFSMGRLSDDIAIPHVHGVTETGMFTAGFDGKVAGSTWRYNGYAQIGRSKASYETRDDPISDNLYRAADAVVDPASGQIVCRSSLTSSDGCVPMNLFGYGSPSQASINYVLGTAYQTYRYHQDVAEVSANGTIFDLPGGPVALAFGASWRKESLVQTADEISQRIRTGAGIQGYPASLVDTLGGFERTNPQPAKGSYNVKEFFAEIELPLLRDLPLVRFLSINAAGRYVDYSTSGSAKPWKVGAVYQPFDWLRFRGTRSTDIRAPNLGELYRGSSQGTANVVDPFKNNANVAVLTGSVGNPNLTPEIAKGTTFGVVLTPRDAIPGLNISVDYYQVKIKDAISTLSAQQEITNCFQGAQEQCAFLQRGADGQLARILLPSFNAAFSTTKGVDTEISYLMPLDKLNGHWAGQLSTRLIVNYLDDLTTAIVGATAINMAGDLSQSYPKWMGTFQMNLDLGKPKLFLQERFISSGRYTSVDLSGGLVTASSIDQNRAPPVWYTDATLSYDISDRINAFFSVTNVLDKAPPQVPSYLTAGSGFGNAPVGGVKGLYDFIGRSFTLGVHFKM
ncbi:MAG TPA: TonB-dependent receptor [Sphingobium sp.]|nr:TonB-dependent receptor [Sphingobium sp.]